MRKRQFIFPAILLSAFFLFAGKPECASAEENSDTIIKGVFIDEVDVSGMTKEQAKEAVKEYAEGLRDKGVAIVVEDEVVYTTMGDLGYMMEENDYAGQALALGKAGNLIKRYKDIKDIEQGNIIYHLSFIYDKTKIRDIVSEKVSAYDIPPKNAKVSRKNGEFVYKNHTVGRKVNVDKTEAAIAEAIDGWNRQDIVVDAVVEDDMPEYTREDVEQCKDLLGSFTTEYTDSAWGRAANLANGARLINNAVLYPGDTFSAYKYLTPFTEANGYFVAGAYLQGKVIDSVGGGACQVTTTLYNAVLKAELEVVERQPHSMTISYVDLSRDAAIAGTYKDFKFKNNTETPVLIEASTQGRKITFKLWGNETRDTKNRKIKFETVVRSETKPPADVITKDPTQPTTYQKVTQSAHMGYRAELYKIVYENGVQVSRTLVNKSSYSAAPRYVTVGTKKVEEEAQNPEKNEENNKNNENEEDGSQDSSDTSGDNLTNPDDQLQGDIWNDLWDEEGYED